MEPPSRFSSDPAGRRAASILPGMTRSSACIFCGRTPLTKEHVLGKWVSKYMPKGGVYELIQKEPDGKTRNMHSRQPGLYEPKIVCGKCNHGY